MTHPLQTNELGLLRMLKGLFIDGKQPKDFNKSGLSGNNNEKFANNLLNKISSNLN